jgi:hypothetical protein
LCRYTSVFGNATIGVVVGDAAGGIVVGSVVSY